MIRAAGAAAPDDTSYGLSPYRRLRNQLPAAIQKLGGRNRAEAVEIAQHKGWL
jgi:hypothetical protein